MPTTLPAKKPAHAAKKVAAPSAQKAHVWQPLLIAKPPSLVDRKVAASPKAAPAPPIQPRAKVGAAARAMDAASSMAPAASNRWIAPRLGSAEARAYAPRMPTALAEPMQRAADHRNNAKPKGNASLPKTNHAASPTMTAAKQRMLVAPSPAVPPTPSREGVLRRLLFARPARPAPSPGAAVLIASYKPASPATSKTVYAHLPAKHRAPAPWIKPSDDASAPSIFSAAQS